MKSYKSISNKYIFLKKKHFFLTLLGIVMSVALITALMTLMYSLVENLHQNEISSNGAYHLEIKGIALQDAETLSNRSELESSGIVYGIDTVSIGMNSPTVAEYTGLSYKIVEISVCNQGALELLPLLPVHGTYPQNPNDIIVGHWFIDNYKESVGVNDLVTLTTLKPYGEGYSPTGTEEYRISGILSGGKNISTFAIGRAAVLTDADIPDGPVTLYVRLARGSSISAFQVLIKSLSPNAEINIHSSLISLEGRNGQKDVIAPVFLIGLLLTVVIVISTIAVIYNSFSISVLEKTSLYGLLRTSGSTPRQIRKLVYREAVYYSAIGIPIGTGIGLLATYILLEFVGFEPFNFTGNGLNTFISPWFVLVGIVIGIITVYISAYIPAVRAGKVTPIEAVSGKKTISLGKPKRIARKTLLGRITGLPGTMAAKNLIRNRRKFRVTIFSIVVSSILFIVFNSFVVYSFDANPNDPIGFDYYIGANTLMESGGFSIADINYLKMIDGVEKVFVQNEFGSQIIVDDEVINMPILAYGDDNLSDYFNGSLPDSMINENRCILIPFYSVKSDGKTRTFEIGEFKVGDTIKCTVWDSEGEELIDFTIEQVHEKDFLVNNRPNQIFMLISESTMQRLRTVNFIHGVYIDTEDNSANVSRNLQYFMHDKPWYTITDLAEMEQQNKKLNIQLSIFFYGFLAVIIMIGSLNIINTINTSLIQRRREFAILGSVGMTRKQLSGMVLIETLVQGLKAGIIGSVIGSLLVFILHKLFLQTFDMNEFTTPWGTIAITMTTSIGISLLSCIAPMKKLRNQDIISTIRSLE